MCVAGRCYADLHRIRACTRARAHTKLLTVNALRAGFCACANTKGRLETPSFCVIRFITELGCKQGPEIQKGPHRDLRTYSLLFRDIRTIHTSALTSCLYIVIIVLAAGLWVWMCSDLVIC